jgi:hypothetical protein
VAASARVAELVDALDLGSSVFGRRGSSPLSRTAVPGAEVNRLLHRGLFCRHICTRTDAENVMWSLVYRT